MNDTNRKQLGQTLWAIADQLRAIPRCDVSGIAIGKTGNATP